MLIVSTLAVGCCRADTVDPSSSLDPSPTPVPSEGARDRLSELGEAWLTTPATITYRTTGHVPGQPTTAHLCLRQMSEGRVRLIDRDQDLGEERTDLLRTCSRQGSLRLVWDPPDAWRMVVVTPVDRFTLISAHGRTRICRGRDPKACAVTSSTEEIGRANADVFFRSPARILHEIGATDVRPTESTDDAVVPVECFAASGRVEHVEWCFDADGVLISFLRGSGGTGWESFEATRIETT